MNDQPRQQQQQQPTLKTFGAQPTAPSGLRRLAPWMLMGATGGTAIAVAMYGAQLFFPDHYKPAVVVGMGAGETVRAEIDASKEAKIDLARRETDAVAQANAKAQQDIAVTTAILQQRTASQEAMTNMAGLSDILCLGAKAVSAFTEPKGWGHQPSDDFYFMAQKTGAATCNAGNIIRQAQTANMLDAVQTATAARGMSMNNGALAVNAAPVQAAPQLVPVTAPPRALPTSLAEVYAIATPSRHWPQPYVMKAREYIKTLSQGTQDRLFANLNEDTGWDVLVDRVQAYQLLPDAPLATAAPMQAAPVQAATPAPLRVTAAHPVGANPAPAAPSGFSAVQQGQLRIYSYGMPVDALRQVTDGLDMSHGYSDAWYARVAAYRVTHKG